VLVGDNQAVKVGQIIARIDPRDYETTVGQAGANVAAARASIDILTEQIAQQRLAVEQTQHAVALDQAALVFSEQNSERYTELAHAGYGPVQQAQQWASDLRQKQAALERDAAGVAVAQKQIEVLQAQLAQSRAAFDLQLAADGATGKSQSQLHPNRRAVRRHGGGAHRKRRPIRPTGHATHGARSDSRRVYHREFHGDAARRRARRSARRNRGRHLRWQSRARLSGKHGSSKRSAIRTFAA
jgi:hypothetical protein